MPGWSLCSQRSHTKKVLPRCAQLRPYQAVWPEDLIERKEIGLDGRSWAGIGASENVRKDRQYMLVGRAQWETEQATPL
mgnify:CR=1 FL=1